MAGEAAARARPLRRATPPTRSALERSIAQLDRLFLLVVIGEFNAGKSAFVNALVGARVLEEGATPTTTRLQILRYGDTPGPRTSSSDPARTSSPRPSPLLAISTSSTRRAPTRSSASTNG